LAAAAQQLGYARMSLESVAAGAGTATPTLRRRFGARPSWWPPSSVRYGSKNHPPRRSTPRDHALAILVDFHRNLQARSAMASPTIGLTACSPSCGHPNRTRCQLATTPGECQESDPDRSRPMALRSELPQGTSRNPWVGVVTGLPGECRGVFAGHHRYLPGVDRAVYRPEPGTVQKLVRLVADRGGAQIADRRPPTATPASTISWPGARSSETTATRATRRDHPYRRAPGVEELPAWQTEQNTRHRKVRAAVVRTVHGSGGYPRHSYCRWSGACNSCASIWA
jgi:hypothetical protein